MINEEVGSFKRKAPPCWQWNWMQDIFVIILLWFLSLSQLYLKSVATSWDLPFSTSYLIEFHISAILFRLQFIPLAKRYHSWIFSSHDFPFPPLKIDSDMCISNIIRAQSVFLSIREHSWDECSHWLLKWCYCSSSPSYVTISGDNLPQPMPWLSFSKWSLLYIQVSTA